MMINLNEKKFEGTSVFNGGKAGTAKDVTLTVEKRGADEPTNYPDYKLFATDGGGSKISQGFYVYKANPSVGADQNEKRFTQEVSRLVHLARAVMGSDYQLPEVTSMQEAADVVFKLVKDNAGSSKFNIFATYGTMTKPSKYLGMRYFNFVEPATENSRFKVGNMDNMERINPDEGPIGNASPSKSASTEDWI